MRSSNECRNSAHHRQACHRSSAIIELNISITSNKIALSGQTTGAQAKRPAGRQAACFVLGEKKIQTKARTAKGLPPCGLAKPPQRTLDVCYVLKVKREDDEQMKVLQADAAPRGGISHVLKLTEIAERLASW